MQVKETEDIYQELRRYDEYGVRDLSMWRSVPFSAFFARDAGQEIVNVGCTRNDRLSGNAPDREASRCRKRMKLASVDDVSVIDIFCLDSTLTATVDALNSTS